MSRTKYIFSIFRLTPVLLATTLVAGCATAPPSQEMSDARQSVEAAQNIGAEEHAPEALTNAQQLLSQAELDMQEGDYQRAQIDAVAAREAAQQALEISQAQIPEIEVKETPVAPTLVEEPVLPRHYTVHQKDNLWQIAAKPDVYGDGRLWPLLLRANAGSLKNANVIQPGQTLAIDRNPSPTDIATALSVSAKHGTPNNEDIDTVYLRQYGLR